MKAVAEKFPPVRRILSIDASTHSLAFCVFHHGSPVRWGIIPFKGKDNIDRIVDAHKKIRAFAKTISVDKIFIEGAVLAGTPNVQVTIKLSMIYGCIIGCLGGVAPVQIMLPNEWMNWIFNVPLTKKQKELIMAGQNKTKSAWTNHWRSLRKQKTIDYIKIRYGIVIKHEDNDVSDAIGLGSAAWDKLSGNEQIDYLTLSGKPATIVP